MESCSYKILCNTEKSIALVHIQKTALSICSALR